MGPGENLPVELVGRQIAAFDVPAQLCAFSPGVAHRGGETARYFGPAMSLRWRIGHVVPCHTSDAMSASTGPRNRGYQDHEKGPSRLGVGACCLARSEGLKPPTF